MKQILLILALLLCISNWLPTKVRFDEYQYNEKNIKPAIVVLYVVAVPFTLYTLQWFKELVPLEAIKPKSDFLFNSQSRSTKNEESLPPSEVCSLLYLERFGKSYSVVSPVETGDRSTGNQKEIRIRKKMLADLNSSTIINKSVKLIKI